MGMVGQLQSSSGESSRGKCAAGSDRHCARAPRSGLIQPSNAWRMPTRCYTSSFVPEIAPSSPVQLKPPDILAYLKALRARSNAIFESSVNGANLSAIAKSYQFGSELSNWAVTLNARREAVLLEISAYEYGFALLGLSQGYYRHAFKGLRLVLELTLQAVLLSANELRLREWLANRRDTSWAQIVGEDGESVFSKTFAASFFPELAPHVVNYGSLATKVYRECSECVHGNIPNYVPLPKGLAFDQPTFDLWHAKAETIALVCHFALVLRYLGDLTEAERTAIEPSLSARLGHVPEIRSALGGRP